MSCSIRNVFIVDVHVLCRKVKNSVGYLMDLVSVGYIQRHSKLSEIV